MSSGKMKFFSIFLIDCVTVCNTYNRRNNCIFRYPIGLFMHRHFICWVFMVCVVLMYGRVQAQSAMDIYQRADSAAMAGRFLDAMTLIPQAVEKARKDSGSNSLYYATLADNAAVFYISSMMADMGLSMSTTAGKIILQQKGKYCIEYAGTLVNRGNAYIVKGDYTKAAIEFFEAGNILDSLCADTTELYTWMLSGKAIINQYNGNSNISIRLLQQAADIYRKHCSDKLYGYATVLNNLGEAYINAGLYSKAETILKEAGEAFEKQQNIHIYYGTYINNVATLNMYMDKLQDAERLYKKALSNLDKNDVTGGEAYIAVLNNTGFLYLGQKCYEEADSVFNLALARLRKAGSGKTIMAVRTLNNLALVYQQKAQWNKADSVLNLAMTYARPLTAGKGQDYTTLQLNQAVIWAGAGKTGDAVMTLAKANDALLYYWRNNFPGMSEKEKLEMSYIIAQGIQLLPSLLHGGYIKATPEICKQLYREQLGYRGVVLLEQRELQHAVSRQNDAEVTAIYNKGVRARQLLAGETAQLFRSKKLTDSLERTIEQTEKELSWRLSSFHRYADQLSPDPALIGKVLKPGEAAIEFFQYQYFNNEWKDSIFYAALVLTHGDTVPAFVPLAEDRGLRQLLGLSGNINSKSLLLAQLYPDLSLVTDVRKTRGYKLYNLIWKPLLPYLQQVKTVYITLSGILHGLAFDALPLNGKKQLADVYSIRYMSGTRMLLDMHEDTPVQTASLWGDVQFSKNTSQVWRQLPHTRAEVSAIAGILRSMHFKVDTFIAANATKPQFLKAMKNKPGILHIATHGYYTPPGITGKQLIETMLTGQMPAERDAMLRCGLVLSNITQSVGVQHDDEVDNNLLTAYEIATADLSNTSLVVLSACETALGDIHNSDGVFGLQRAFKMAGVQHIIMSLWSVPDKPTADLMTTFYRNLSAGRSVQNAFALAQQYMRKKYPPYYWAGFVLVQ